MTFSVWVAIALSAAMITVSVFTWFYHDSKHRDLDSWVDFGFSRDTLRHALFYYRFMGLSAIVFYALFTVSCLMLQSDSIKIFSDAEGPTFAGPFSTAVFALDLVLRGAFFDFMQHFDLRVTHLSMNRKVFWFVWYAFAFRMYYGLTLIRLIVSFAWIWTKIRLVKQKHMGDGRG